MWGFLAEVFGWEVEATHGSRKGPDIVIKHVGLDGKVISVMFVESEVGHDQGNAREYFESLCRRLAEKIKDYGSEGASNIVVVAITDAPRRLSDYPRKEGDKVAKELGLEHVKEDFNFYIVPAILAKELLPAIFVRALS